MYDAKNAPGTQPGASHGYYYVDSGFGTSYLSYYIAMGSPIRWVGQQFVRTLPRPTHTCNTYNAPTIKQGYSRR